MGTHADEQWAKGLEECKNPEHEHPIQRITITPEQKKRVELYQKGYEDGFDAGVRSARIFPR